MKLTKLHKYCFWFPYYLRFVLKGNRKCFSIFTNLTIIGRLLLYKLSLSLKLKPTIVEIGSYFGASSTFLAYAAKEKKGKLYCVDTWKVDARVGYGGFKDTYSDFIRNTQCCKDWIIPLRGRSIEVAKRFNKTIDLLFIDGDHSYEGVKADIIAWFPKLEKEAIVIFHDYVWFEGVRRAVDEIVKPLQIGKGYVLDNTYWSKIKKVSMGN